jgi:hypothetical protein
VRVLLDEQLPVDLDPELHGHQVDTVVGRGWTGVKNSDLLRRMRGDYDVLVTMDRVSNSSTTFRRFPTGVVLVRAASNRMQHLRPLVPTILDAIATTKPGQLQRVGA